MKKEFISILKQNVGKSVSEQIAGFGGWLNPILKHINDEGDLQLDFRVRDEMLNPMGTMHGGAISAIIDEALGMQLFVKSAEDAIYLAINLQVDFIKAVRVGAVITAIPEVIRIGRRSANVTCTLRNEENKIVARGSSNFMQIS